jgi:hypothetical protein
MTFSPIIPAGGLTGWTILKKTREVQVKAFTNSAAIRGDQEYFREKIGGIKTADQLVSDRRLLKVALTAFGLEADINAKAFIKKVLSDGTLDTKALANRLADKQYLAMSAAFGFGDFSIPRTQISDFADKILGDYRARSFEIAIGENNSDMRLALTAERELGKLAASGISEDAKWFTVMGSRPLRKVFETALGLPSRFGALDLDQQLLVLKQKAGQRFGDDRVTQFNRPEAIEMLIRNFLVRSEAGGQGNFSPAKSALALLTAR